MPASNIAEEQIVGLSDKNIVLFVVDAKNTSIGFDKSIETLRTNTGYSNLSSIVTIPIGMSPPSTLAVYTATAAQVHDFTDEEGGGGIGTVAFQEPAQFTNFSNQYLFMQDAQIGLNGATSGGVVGCGDYLLGEEVEQSVHRIYSRGKTSGVGDIPTHRESTVKWAYTSGYFGGSGSNSLGGTGGYLEIYGDSNSPFPQGISLDGHQVVKIQFWFNFDGYYPPDNAVLFGKKYPSGTTGGPFFMDYDAPTNKLRFNTSLGNTGASFNKSVSATLPAGTTSGWHHCQVERSNDYIRIFIDGIVKDQTAVSNNDYWYGGETNSFTIGAEKGGGNSYKGYMSDFQYTAADTSLDASEWTRILDGPSGGTMASGASISMPNEIGTGDVKFTKLLIPMHGISGCKNFVERGFNIVTGRAAGWYTGGPSGSTTNDTGNRLTVSNIGVTGAATGFSAGYGFVYGFSGTGGSGGFTGAGVGGTYGFTGSMAAHAVSYIPYDDILGITLSKIIAISNSQDDFKTDIGLGVSGSTQAANNLNWLFGVSGGNSSDGASGAGVSGGASGAYFSEFNFRLTPDTYNTLASQAAAVEAGYDGTTSIVDYSGTSQIFRPNDVTFLFRDVSVYFQERSSSQQEVEGNINAVTDFKQLTDSGGKGNSRTTIAKNSADNAISYARRQSDKSGVTKTSASSSYTNGK